MWGICSNCRNNNVTTSSSDCYSRCSSNLVVVDIIYHCYSRKYQQIPVEVATLPFVNYFISCRRRTRGLAWAKKRELNFAFPPSSVLCRGEVCVCVSSSGSVVPSLLSDDEIGEANFVPIVGGRGH